jgi:hypothetical protein
MTYEWSFYGWPTFVCKFPRLIYYAGLRECIILLQTRIMLFIFYKLSLGTYGQRMYISCTDF